MAIACSTRRHPQLRVTPPRRERPLTVQELPQSQRHRQHGRSSSASSAIATTTKRPNLWPIKSRNGLPISIKINFEIEERMTAPGNLARVDDFNSLRWPKAKITLRQGARVVARRGLAGGDHPSSPRSCLRSMSHASLDPERVTANCLHPATYMATTMVRQSGVTPISTVEEGAEAI